MASTGGSNRQHGWSISTLACLNLTRAGWIGRGDSFLSGFTFRTPSHFIPPRPAVKQNPVGGAFPGPGGRHGGRPSPARLQCPHDLSRRCLMRCRLAGLALLVLLPPPLHAAAPDRAGPDWVPAMRKVHARFGGKKGTFALFGDSITVSLAFWAGLPGDRKNLDPEGQAAFKLVQAHMIDDCWRKWRGPAYGNNGGMTVRWANDNVDAW